MQLKSQTHPRWGSNLGELLESPKTYRTYGEDGQGYKTVEVPRFFYFLWGPPTKLKRKYVGHITATTTDLSPVLRKFRHKTGITKITVKAAKCGSQFYVEFDSLPGMVFQPHEVQLEVNPALAAHNQGRAVALVWFEGIGPRNGPLERYKGTKATLRFASQEQMDEMVAFDRKMPSTIADSTGRSYAYDSGSSCYRSDDGSTLNTLLILWMVCSPDQRGALAEKHAALYELAPEKALSESLAAASESGTTFDPASGSSDANSGFGGSSGGDFGGGGSDSGSGGGGGSDGGGGGGD